MAEASAGRGGEDRREVVQHEGVLLFGESQVKQAGSPAQIPAERISPKMSSRGPIGPLRMGQQTSVAAKVETVGTPRTAPSSFTPRRRRGAGWGAGR
ncbi:hypothetical protein GCM10009639_40990 [Kitasatospora putterlickiae]|uniref:Uncharacterized protein n=1 Tax=Kitasatospora putterlickiae TaxID=221725 RepID=A0ABN1Y7R4_9ACTN